MTTIITLNGTDLDTVTKIKYLRAIISEEGSKKEILARAAQTTTAVARLKPIWRDNNIALKYKLNLLQALVLSLFLYAWTMTAEFQRRIQSVEMQALGKSWVFLYRSGLE